MHAYGWIVNVPCTLRVWNASFKNKYMQVVAMKFHGFYWNSSTWNFIAFLLVISEISRKNIPHHSTSPEPWKILLENAKKKNKTKLSSNVMPQLIGISTKKIATGTFILDAGSCRSSSKIEWRRWSFAHFKEVELTSICVWFANTWANKKWTYA